MTTKENAALLEKSRRYLAFLESCFTESIQNSNFALAGLWKSEHEGAVRMLYALELISDDERKGRMMPLHDQFEAAVHSGRETAG